MFLYIQIILDKRLVSETQRTRHSLVPIFPKYGKFSENTGGLIDQDLCPLTFPYIIYNNAI